MLDQNTKNTPPKFPAKRLNFSTSQPGKEWQRPVFGPVWAEGNCKQRCVFQVPLLISLGVGLEKRMCAPQEINYKRRFISTMFLAKTSFKTLVFLYEQRQKSLYQKSLNEK